jgi:hypothetical protein
VGELGYHTDEFPAVEIMDTDAVKRELISKLESSTERTNLCECSLV